MNKGDLIDELAKELESKKTAKTAVEGVLSIITASLKKGEKVSLIGFGTFEVADRKARKVRNPRTGEELTVAATRVPRFSPGKALKAEVKK